MKMMLPSKSYDVVRNECVQVVLQKGKKGKDKIMKKHYLTPTVEITRFELRSGIMWDIPVGGGDDNDPLDEGSHPDVRDMDL